MVLEVVISFVIGAAVMGLLAFIFALKTKGFARLLINLLAGITALIVLVLFQVPPFTLSPLSAFLIGLLGVPGLIVIYVILMFL